MGCDLRNVERVFVVYDVSQHVSGVLQDEDVRSERVCYPPCDREWFAEKYSELHWCLFCVAVFIVLLLLQGVVLIYRHYNPYKY